MKKQRGTKRLRLNRETMRRLDEEKMREAQGRLATNFCTRAYSCEPESIWPAICEYSMHYMLSCAC